MLKISTLVIAVAASLALLPAASLPARAADDVCTTDSLPVDGSTVVATFCVPPGRVAAGGTVTVRETFARGAQTVSSSVDIPVAAGDDVPRGIDDVKLQALGLQRTLHLTVAYRGGRGVLEHALLLPGALPLK